MNEYTRQPGQINISEIVSMYIDLASITNPTETLTQIKARLENIILLFASSLGNPQ